MFISYGSWVSALNEAAVAITKSAILTKASRQVGIKERWTISGFLQAADPASLTVLLTLMEDAFALDHQALRLIANDGATVLRLVPGLDPMGGTKVVDGLSFPESGERDAEYSTYRRYTAVVEAEYATDGVDVLVEWLEKLTFRGGGPRFVHLQPLVGRPQKQQVAETTPYTVMQRGRAVGLFSWPTPPGPLFPAACHQDQIEIDQEDPERRGGDTPVYVNWPVSWSYPHEDAGPLTGTPNLWT